MYHSAKKKQDNVVEYLLYMWQIEDLIRSCQFNIDEIYSKIIQNSPYTAPQKAALKNWYIDLMYVMESENIQEKGHMSDLVEVQDSLDQLHMQLLSVYQNPSYQKATAHAAPYMKELKRKSNDLIERDVDACLEFMYGTLLLQLQQKSLSEATLLALKYVSNLMFTLAEMYKDQKYGFLNFSSAQKN